MTKYALLAVLALGWATAQGQTVIQGDSLFRGLRIGQSSLEQVTAQLGRHYRAEKIIGQSLAKLRSGGCVTIKREIGVSLHYRTQGMVCYVNTTKRHRGLAGITFDSTAKVCSAKGIQPGKYRFADVIARYGPIDFEKKDNSSQQCKRFAMMQSSGTPFLFSLLFVSSVSARSDRVKICF